MTTQQKSKNLVITVGVPGNLPHRTGVLGEWSKCCSSKKEMQKYWIYFLPHKTFTKPMFWTFGNLHCFHPCQQSSSFLALLMHCCISLCIADQQNNVKPLAKSSLFRGHLAYPRESKQDLMFSQAFLLHSSHNYCCHILCIQTSATLWMLSHPICAIHCTLSFSVRVVFAPCLWVWLLITW